MTTDTTKPATQQGARTDDLLASGADAKDGARGFDSEADPQALQTGMEGIADTTSTEGSGQDDTHNPAATTRTVPDNPARTGNGRKNE